jgi:hypothetical protein
MMLRLGQISCFLAVFCTDGGKTIDGSLLNL